jgi:uncharacterized iron-regulated membrane protein
MSLQNWHRWLVTVFAVLLTYWIGSGLLMGLYDAADSSQAWAIEGGGPGARLSEQSPSSQPVPAIETLRSGIAIALARATSMNIASVRLRVVGPEPEIEFATADGDRQSMLRFFALTGEPMTAAQADGDPAAQSAAAQRRNVLKSWHRGNIAGIFGQIIGLTTGVALTAIAVTGLGAFLGIWRLRRQRGRTAVFWTGRESLWRRMHRWTSVIAAVLVLNLALTGSVLAYGEIQLWAFLHHTLSVPAPYPRPGPLPPVSAQTLSSDIPTMLGKAFGSANTQASGISKIEIVSRNSTEMALVTTTGPSPRILAIDANTGKRVADWSESGVQRGNGYFTDWHQVVKRMHRGDIIGRFAGRYVMLANGLALAYLLISGVVMYLQLRHGRRGRGHRWFWR